jgi:hypothetical protein
MALTDVAVRTAKPSEKARKLADEKGMYLLIQSSGAKLWHMDYRFDTKRKTLALGTYPERGGPAQLDRNLVFLSEFSAG